MVARLDGDYLTAVLEAEPEVFQVGINFVDATQLTGTCAAEEAVCRAPDAGRYVVADAVAGGPAMFDTTRLDRAGGPNDTDPNPITPLGQRAAAAGPRAAASTKSSASPSPTQSNSPHNRSG